MELDCTKFYPSELQRRLLNVVQEAGYAISIREACTRAEIARQDWYNWSHDDGFLLWWNTERERYWSWRLAEVDAAAFRAATGKAEGSPADRRLLLERYDTAFKPQRRMETSSRIEKPDDLESLAELTRNVMRILGGEDSEAEGVDESSRGSTEGEGSPPAQS